MKETNTNPVDWANRSAVACIATAAGRGAVATVLACGGQLDEVLLRHFQPARRTNFPVAVDRPRFGYWVDGDFREEVVIAALENPDVAVGRAANAVEVHCHGGRIPAQCVLNSFVAAGFATCSWELWNRALSYDAITATAIAHLSRAPTERIAWILLDQVQGAWQRDFRQGSTWIREGNWAEVTRKISRWKQLLPAGRRLSKPARVVLAGPPNVGKSSLLNRMVGFERAIVYDRPGTTRDSLWVPTAIDGWEFEFWDTAGIRHTADEIEGAGVRMSHSAIQQADLVIWLSEATGKAIDPPSVPQSVQILEVLNKSDLVTNPGGGLEPSGPLPISALTGAGIDQLLQEIRVRLIPFLPAAGESVPFSSWLQHWVEDLAFAYEASSAETRQDSPFRDVWQRIQGQLAVDEA